MDTDVIAAALLAEPGRGEQAGRLLLFGHDLLAPAHWTAELANVTWKAVMLGLLAPASAAGVLDTASMLPITSVPTDLLWKGAVGLSITTGHPVYDTLFVHLAERESTRMVTYDAKLRRRFPSLAWEPHHFL